MIKNMKALAVGGLMGLMLVGKSMCAWDQPRNPDRFISVGLKIENTYLSGDFTTVSNPGSFPLVERGFANRDSIDLGLNLRIPANNSLTIDVDYVNVDGEERHNRNNNIYRDASNLNGYRASVGFRFYLNH